MDEIDEIEEIDEIGEIDIDAFTNCNLSDNRGQQNTKE